MIFKGGHMFLWEGEGGKNIHIFLRCLNRTLIFRSIFGLQLKIFKTSRGLLL